MSDLLGTRGVCAFCGCEKETVLLTLLGPLVCHACHDRQTGKFEPVELVDATHAEDRRMTNGHIVCVQVAVDGNYDKAELVAQRMENVARSNGGHDVMVEVLEAGPISLATPASTRKDT